MLTEKECRTALEILKEKANGETVDAVVCFKELIEEHFDNQPLKFEELKEGMLVYDKNIKSWIEIDKTFEDIEKYVSCWSIGWPYEKRFPYEPNRFYRKEVKDVD